ncbi:MAG: hypothetical protein HY075_03580 [Deltaproteobacteria bacterium]|nr:hypothetical protein [Deltaproteobacteria bacterium]
MRVLMLFDLAEQPPKSQDEAAYAADLDDEAWESEAAILAALRRLGHDVRLFGIHDDIRILLDELQASRPDVVFNLCEAFRSDRALEAHVPALLELLGMKTTGARPAALALCKDKAMSKRVVASSGVRVPRFEVSSRSSPLASFKHVGFPAIVKPLGLESSTGISQDSLVSDEQAALERARFVHERLGQDAIVEEYVEGRELYVGVLGNWDCGRLEVFPPRELFFDEVPDGDPKFATFKAKWDDAYRKKWGIRNGFAAGLGDALEKRVSDVARAAYRALQISGYARLDLRLTPEGELVFLEANPNPSIARDDDFAAAAAKHGLPYDKLVARLIKLSGA